MAARSIGAEVCVRSIQTNTSQLDELGWQSPFCPGIRCHLNGPLRPKGVPFAQLAQGRRPRACSLVAASDEWDCLLFLAPVWTDQYMAMCIELYGAKVLPPKELELLLIAFDASYGNAFGPYTRHHIKNAFKAGATTDEIMQVLKLGVIRGMQACTLGVSILAEELERNAASQRASA